MDSFSSCAPEIADEKSALFGRNRSGSRGNFTAIIGAMDSALL